MGPTFYTYCPYCKARVKFRKTPVGIVRPCENCGARVLIEPGKRGVGWRLLPALGIVCGCLFLLCLLLIIGYLVWWLHNPTG